MARRRRDRAGEVDKSRERPSHRTAMIRAMALVLLVVIGCGLVTVYVDVHILCILQPAMEPSSKKTPAMCQRSIPRQGCGGDANTTAVISVPPTNEQQLVPRPYGAFCNTTVLGERQLWNRDRKKIISFALFAPTPGDDLAEWLRQGTMENIQDAKLYYPEWIVRIHAIGLSSEDQALFLQHDNVELVQCLENTPPDQGLARSKSRKMITRFLAYDDSTVLYMISRDVDSRFSPRELLAVNEWLSSGLCFHIMRDHKYHTNPVMGGMFGIRRGCLDAVRSTVPTTSDNDITTTATIRMTDLVQKALTQEPDKMVGAQAEDQSFLATYVWPLVKGNTMNHDTNQQKCNHHGAAVCRPYPLKKAKDSSAFIGMTLKYKGNGGKGNRGVVFAESAQLVP